MNYEYKDEYEFEDDPETSPITGPLLRLEQQAILEERAELLAAALRTNPQIQAISEEILEIVNDVIASASELITASRALYASAVAAQANGGDDLDVAQEHFAISYWLLDIVDGSNESSERILDIVRELIDGQGGRGGGYEQR